MFNNSQSIPLGLQNPEIFYYIRDGKYVPHPWQGIIVFFPTEPIYNLRILLNTVFWAASINWLQFIQDLKINCKFEIQHIVSKKLSNSDILYFLPTSFKEFYYNDKFLE